MIENAGIWLQLHPGWVAGSLVVSMATLILWGFIGNAKPKRHGNPF